MDATTRLRLGNALLGGWAPIIDRKWRGRVRRYRRDQLALARRYDVAAAAPDLYGPTTVRRIADAARRVGGPVVYALTSGTTGEPKRLLYPRTRTRQLRLLTLGQVLLAYHHLALTRPVFYVLTDLRPGPSLSALIARDPRVGLMERWIFPESFLPVADVFALAERYSQEALHLTLLALASPTMVVTVNPSSLFVVLHRAQREWDAVRREVELLLDETGIRSIRRRLGAAGGRRAARLSAMLAAGTPPAAQAVLPDLRAVYCWDGGDVRPFTDNLRALLPLGVVFFPMFSVSTEAIETLVLPRVSAEGGLPIAPDVCYEFLPAGDAAPSSGPAAPPTGVLKPWDLEPGGEYEMVVSDPYGLLRYRTEDIFACLGRAGDAPILRFVRRGGLGYSFTGEKLTGQQLEVLYARLRRDLDTPGLILTCFPRLNPGAIPGYVVVCCAPDRPSGGRLPTPEAIDRGLMEVNLEYAAKRRSGRLSPPEVQEAAYPALVQRILAHVGHETNASTSQFKLLPLYAIPWETLDARPPLVPLGAAGRHLPPHAKP